MFSIQGFLTCKSKLHFVLKSAKFNWLPLPALSIVLLSTWKAFETSVFSNTETGKTLKFLTNNMALSALTICALYKQKCIHVTCPIT